MIKAGILGCTGMVGQKFIELLKDHPLFYVGALGASERSEGKVYENFWRQTTQCPDSVRDIVVTLCDPELFKGCGVIFSALDPSVAGSVEIEFAYHGFPVFSNARNHRRDRTVPILVPYVNADHIHMVDHQIKNIYTGGFIVTNGNCSSTGLTIALKPLYDEFGISKVSVVTMQAVSGAGYPGVSSLDMIDNIIPHISGEEGKLEYEPLKILGVRTDDGVSLANMTISAQCNRVGVTDGHTACVSVELKTGNVTLQDIHSTLSNYTSPIHHFNNPLASHHPIHVTRQVGRPQPRLDRMRGNGYTVTVGGIRECKVIGENGGFKFTLCSHNTIIGAAGGSIMNAELAYTENYIKPDFVDKDSDAV
jgi:aspartate-semialdehyde dehydrogenase